MKRNIIMAVISFIGVSVLMVLRKGWVISLIIFIAALLFLFISGIGGAIIDSFL